jgi:hypothetical protein
VSGGANGATSPIPFSGVAAGKRPKNVNLPDEDTFKHTSELMHLYEDGSAGAAMSEVCFARGRLCACVLHGFLSAFLPFLFHPDGR